MLSRSDDKRSGYGLTTFPDGQTIERGKYKDNVIVKTDIGVSGTRRLFDFRLSKLKDRIEAGILHAQKSAEIATQKSDIAVSRYCRTLNCKELMPFV